MGDRGGKLKKIKQEKGLRFFCLLDSNDSELSKLTTFFC